MKRRINKLIIMFAFMLVINGNAVGVNVASEPNESMISSSLFSKDVIVKKYRTYDGKLQYRHWNSTQGYWVESDWITMN